MANLMIQFVDVTIEPLHMLTNLSSDAGRCAAGSVLLSHTHLHELAAAGGQDCQLLGRCIRQGPHFRTDSLGKIGRDLRVDAVSLANLPVAFAKSRACLGLTATTGSFAAAKRRDNRQVDSSGRLQHDE